MNACVRSALLSFVCLASLGLATTAEATLPAPVYVSDAKAKPELIQLSDRASDRTGVLLRDLKWPSWGGSSATGSGLATISTSSRPEGFSERHVDVTLDGLANCGGQPVYTDLHVALAQGQS